MPDANQWNRYEPSHRLFPLMLWRHRPRGLLTVVEKMRNGIPQDDLREVLRIETAHCKQQCRELESQVDELIPALEGLIQTLEQWVGDYPRGRPTTTLRRYKQIRRRDIKPIQKRLVRIIKRL